MFAAGSVFSVVFAGVAGEMALSSDLEEQRVKPEMTKTSNKALTKYFLFLFIIEFVILVRCIYCVI